ncbi:MAG: LuxR C-terminal-related transcriptional regulator, partial [Muribaculaceae bacterium]|nr:LuxR C-terminal-related transcriptional regulator [Muribaculaceae bacterium]
NGLPTGRNTLVSLIDGRPVISTEGGFFRFDSKTNTLVADTHMAETFGYQPSPRLYHPAANELISVNLTRIICATRDASGTFRTDSVTLNPIAEKLIAGHDNFYFISPRRVIVPNQDGFFDVDLDRQTPLNDKNHTFIHHIYASGDSLVYAAADIGDSHQLKLPYSLNSLKFEFVSPEYRAPDAVVYSCMLENYDTDFSPWSTANSKEYTRLHEGTYTMRVRSHNNYTHQRGETSFTVVISPPWYRSTTAKAIYFILVAAGLWVLFRVLHRASHRATIKVQQEKEQELAAMRRQAREENLRKDYEIAAMKGQPLEHDIKHKSEELSNITMNVVRKNEILLDIADRLTKIQEHDDVKAHRTPEVQRQLAKIQTVIRDNIAHDDDWKDFTHNFDLAYDNFTQKLLQAHPELTESDLRICCYLRMGLSSKEIAPLLNISYRSVEMSRYRLRKKMRLTRDVNLTEYLQKQ